MERLLDVLAVFSVLLLLIVLRGLRRSRIRVEYSVSWLAAAVALFVLSRSRGALEWVAGYLRLNEPALALIILILLVFLGVFYRFSIIISQLKDMNITLTQRVATLDYQVRSLQCHAEETAKNWARGGSRCGAAVLAAALDSVRRLRRSYRRLLAGPDRHAALR